MNQSEELEAFFSLNLDLLCIADLEGNFLKTNEAWSHILGYSTEELNQRKFLEFVHPDDMEATLGAMEDLGKGNNVIEFTNRYQCKDGSYRFIEWRSHPRGNLIYAAARDVTKKYNDIEKLRMREEETNSILQSIDDMVFVLDCDLIFRRFNASSTDKLFIQAEKFIGKDFNSLGFPEPAYSQIKSALTQSLETGRTAFVSYFLDMPEGKSWFEARITSIKGVGTEPDGLTCVIRDVTDRVVREQELKKEKKQVDLFFNQSLHGFFICMLDEPIEWNDHIDKKKMIEYVLDHQKITRVNQAMLDQYGAEEKEFIGKTVRDLFKHDLDHAREIWTGLFDKGKWHVETYEQKLDGTPIIIDGDYICLYDDKGRITGHFGVQMDITERKIAEEEIKKSKDFLAQTGNVAKVGGWNFNNLTGEISWTDTICDIHEVPHGYTPTYEEMASFYTPDSWVKLQNAIQESMSTGASYDMELQITTAKGRLLWVRAIGNAEWENGVCVRLFGVLQDISERKKSEEKIRESESKLQSVLDEVEDVIWSVRMPDYKMLLVTPSVEKFYGYPIDEWMVDSSIWQKVIHPEDQGLVPEIFRRLETEGFSDTEYRIITKQGVTKWIKSKAKIILDENHKPARIDGFAQDITERKKAEAEIISAKQQAEAASKAKSEFLANMSHEIRTPLNGVIGFTELLKTTPLSPVQQKYVDSANISGHTLLGIINDILDFSKIEAGMLQLEKIQTDMVELLENSTDIVKYQAAKKGLELLLHIDPAMPRFAITDPIRLKQVLANLLGNAVKFTETGEVELRMKYEALQEGKGKLSFFVRDTGIGLSEEQKNKLFKAFSQADSSTTRKYGGTGLGLIISDMIVKEMGGEIRVESKVGEGSIFSFEIVTNVEEGDRLEPGSLKSIKSCLVIDDNESADTKQQMPIITGKATVLIAEDVELNMLMIKALLSGYIPDANLVEAANGQEAVRLAGEIAPDLIFMDVQMPEMDGLEATKKIRELEKESGHHVPIIALTAGAFREEEERCFAAGMDDFLTKPVNPEKIKAVLKNYLSDQEVNRMNIAMEDSQHFNKNQLLGKINGSEELIKQLVAMALLDFPKTLDQLKEAIREGNPKNIRDLAHRFKGSSYSLNCSRLAEIASTMEQMAGAEKDALALKEKYNELHAEWEIVKGMLESSKDI